MPKAAKKQTPNNVERITKAGSRLLVEEAVSKGALLQRTFTIGGEGVRMIDEKERTVEVAFSSEYPVERWFGIEILDHGPDGMDLSRLTDGGAVLVDHNRTDHVGVVESAEIGGDRVGRAVLRFGRSARASEIFTDVIDEIRTKVSVGYSILDFEEVDNPNGDEDVPAYRFKIQPNEISIVSVPADPSVGVGRSISPDCEGSDMKNLYRLAQARGYMQGAAGDGAQGGGSGSPAAGDEGSRGGAEPAAPAPAAAPRVDVSAVEQSAREAEQKRGRAILQIGRRFDLVDEAERAIESGATVEAFQKTALDTMAERQKGKQGQAHLDLSAGDQRSYSLIRAVRAAVSNDWRHAGFELECSREIAERVGRDPKGFFVPVDMLNAGARAMATGSGVGLTDNSDIVATDHAPGMFIDALRARSVVMGLNPVMLEGLVGDLNIPKLTAGADWYWLTEDEDVTDSDATTGTVALTPKTVAGSVPMTRKLLKQSSPSVEAMVLGDLIAGSAVAIDAAALNGSGASGQPTGIIGASGINTQTIASAGSPTWAEMVGFETAVDVDNALQGSLAYVMASAVMGSCKTTPKESGAARYIAEDGEINGYGALRSNNMPSNGILFGNFNDVVIGMWGILDINPDTATKAASGGLVLRAFQDVDIAVRNAVSFCKNA